MKKVAWAALAAVTVLFNTAVFADATASYTGTEDNAAAVSGAGSYEVICITKDDANVSGITEGNIVYLNQASDVYSGSMDFLLKANASPGKYKVRFGSSSVAPAPAYFYIMEAKNDSNVDDTSMTRLGEEAAGSGYNIAYTITANIGSFADYKSVKVVFHDETEGDLVGGFEFNSGNYGVISGETMLVFQLNGVPEQYRNSVSVYLSEDEPGTKRLFENGGE